MKNNIAADRCWECMEHLADLVTVVSRDFKLKYLNKAALEFYGIKDDVSGRCCHEMLHGRERPCRDYGEPCPAVDTLAAGKSIKVVHCHLNGEGREYFQEITTAPIFNRQGEAEDVLQIIRIINNSALLEKIEASEQRYKSILASSPNAVITIDNKGTVVDCNQAVEGIFGLPATELTGCQATVLMPERFRSQHRQGLEKAVREGLHKYAGKTVDLTGWRLDRQEEFPVSLSLAAWQEREEHFFTAIITDGSRQKALERSLQKEKDRLEQAQVEQSRQHADLKDLFGQVERVKREWERTMDCIADLVMLVDDQDLVLRCNKAVLEFVGLSYEELMGQNWEELLFGHGMETHFSRGKSIELFHRPTNRWFFLNIYDYGKDRYFDSRYVVTLHEITRVKQISQQLQKTNADIEENRRKLKVALDEISSLIEKVTSSAQNSGIRFENPGLKNCWQEMNCSRQDCPCHGQEAQRCWQQVGTLCNGEIKREYIQKLAHCSNCSFYQEATRDPIFQIGEQFNNMMHILEKKNNELEDAYKELKATQAQILQQEKLASIGQLAAGVAHELNNPLGFIASNLGTLQRYMARVTEFLELQGQAVRPDGETARALAERRQKLRIDHILEDTGDLISESLEGADRLKKIIQDLKSFSRVDQAQFTHANIIECLESTINIAWNELKYNTVVTRDYGDLPLTKCYPQQLNQVFMNLLINAAHAIGAGKGEIMIRAWCDGDSIFVAVSDTGCGIPEENLKKLFDPFFTTKEVGKGTGLGLSIAFDIIKKHQGELTVASEVGKGSTFTMRIPVVEGR